jgi:hypothetical protein
VANAILQPRIAREPVLVDTSSKRLAERLFESSASRHGAGRQKATRSRHWCLSQEIRCTQSLRYHLQEWVMMGMLSCIGARGVDGKALGPILILRDGTNRLCRADAHSGFRIGFRMEQFLPVHRVGSDCRLPFGRGEPGREAMRGSLLRLRMGLWVKQDDIIEIQ